MWDPRLRESDMRQTSLNTTMVNAFAWLLNFWQVFSFKFAVLVVSSFPSHFTFFSRLLFNFPLSLNLSSGYSMPVHVLSMRIADICQVQYLHVIRLYEIIWHTYSISISCSFLFIFSRKSPSLSLNHTSFPLSLFLFLRYTLFLTHYFSMSLSVYIYQRCSFSLPFTPFLSLSIHMYVRTFKSHSLCLSLSVSLSLFFSWPVAGVHSRS